jgi:membrane associated rhomboid family serine protease
MYDLWTVDVPMQRWPFANWCLIVFIVLVSNIAWGMEKPKDTRRLEQLMQEISKPRQPNSKDKLDRVDELMREAEKLQAAESVPGTLHPHHFHFYQLVTSLLVHANLSHLIGNMFFLFVFGNAINAKLGHGWYLLCFFAIGILENVLWLGIGGGRSCLGASAAIMGIVGLFLVFYPRNDIKMVWWFYGIEVDHYYISAIWIILLYVAMDLIGAIWFGNAGIGFVSHLAGALMGFLIGIIALKQEWIEPVYEEENLLQFLGMQKKLSRYEV